VTLDTYVRGLSIETLRGIVGALETAETAPLQAAARMHLEALEIALEWATTLDSYRPALVAATGDAMRLWTTSPDPEIAAEGLAYVVRRVASERETRRP